jgi:RES domain-containing protein
VARLFRIGRTIFVPNPNKAFDGEGALRGGSRWNTPGHRISFASTSRSLAQLEYLAHIDWPATVNDELTLIEASLDDDFIDEVHDADLPSDWGRIPPSAASQRLGDQWLLSGSSAGLSVPSAIVKAERNVLINPLHPDFKNLTVDAMRPFAFDSRLRRVP